MKHQIVFTNQALANRDESYSWYAEHYSKKYADTWYTDLYETIERLRTNPDRCSNAPENHRFPFALRHIIFGRGKSVHRILFTVHGDVVSVLHIRHRLPLLKPIDLE